MAIRELKDLVHEKAETLKPFKFRSIRRRALLAVLISRRPHISTTSADSPRRARIGSSCARLRPGIANAATRWLLTMMRSSRTWVENGAKQPRSADTDPAVC